MNEIRWRKKALKQLRKIKKIQDQNRIFEAVDGLKNYSNYQNVKKVKNTEFYRLRVGNWRVFISLAVEIVFIEKVKKRNEQTY